MAAAQPVNTEEPTGNPANADAAPVLSTVEKTNTQSDSDAMSAAAASNPTRPDPSKAPTSAPSAGSSESIGSKPVAPELAASKPAASEPSELEKNATKRVVDEVVGLMGDIHETKEEIIARGIPFHMANALVELGVHGKFDEQAVMRKTALETSQKQYGGAAITPEKLDGHLDTLVNLEKDLGHVRRLGREQGLDMNSINYLTLIIRQNPGDGGEKMINTFLAYALACDIPLHRIEEILEEATSGPKSVLPDIPRDDTPDLAAADRKRLITDICVGCAMALLALTLLT